MRPVRIGAVGYLNARPLTWWLDREPERWLVRYDLPAVCADLLRSGDVDLGLVPCIEYLGADDYRFVPGVGIGSKGPVASVALYTRRPIGEVASIALDTSSRTSVALTRVLCRFLFRIAPAFVPHAPDLTRMLTDCDAALLIGDPALELDHRPLGVEKIDLGEAWLSLTGLPFVYAAWAGRPGAVSPADVEALQEAQRQGVAAVDAIAREYAGGDEARIRRSAAYLTDNVRYGLGRDEADGLQRFLDYAVDVGVAPRRRRVEFF